MYRKLHIIILLLILSCLPLTAQENLHFRHTDTRGYFILTFYKDANGVMWFGTNSGLVSFPQLMSRMPNSYDRGFPELNSSIYLISGDNAGRLWMKTINRDVIMYDPKHNQFEFDTSPLLSRQGINVYKEYDILVDKSGKSWVWKDHKLYYLYSQQSRKQAIEVSLKNEKILNIVPADMYIVVLTQTAIYYLSSKDGKILRRVKHEAKDQMWSYISVMPNQDVWMRSDRYLTIYDYATNRWRESIEFPSKISSMEMDDEQNVWIATNNDGIYIYDNQGSVIRQLTHDVWDANSLQSNKICSMYYDKEAHTMWISYIKGGMSVCSKRKGTQLNLIGEKLPAHFPTDILTLAGNRQGTIYAGLEEHGLYELEYSGGWRNILDGASISSILCGKDDLLWVGLYAKGLMKRNAVGEHQIYFAGNSPYDIVEYSKGAEHYIYTALLGKGVWRLNVSTGEVCNMKVPENFTLDLEFFEDKLYAATTGGFFVMKEDGRWGKVCDGKFRSFCIDSRGHKWILGNDGYEGLTVLNPQNRRIKTSSNLVHAPLKSIVADNEDRVWITTSNELIMLQIERNSEDKIAQYLYGVNTNNEYVYYNYKAILIDHSNQLWMGSSRGYQCCNIRDLIHQTDRHPSGKSLMIGSIAINDKVCSPGDTLGGKTVLDRDVIFCRELNLKHDENNIVIECAQSGNEDFDTYIYYYRLCGSNDEAWHPLVDNSIVLSNLSPGDYRLEVKTQSSEEQPLLAIRIALPFWLSFWAYMLYVTVCAAVVYVVVRYYTNKKSYQLRLRKLELQQEQQSLINEIKLRFFTNISHDLRTPLSLIIGPAEDLDTQLTDSRQRESLSIIKRNAEHLLTLVNQILDFRKLEFGHEKLVLTHGDIVSFVSDVSDTFRQKSVKEGITLVFTPSVKRVETLFDHDKTTKIMMNLLSNAFKFTNPGGTITITLDVISSMITISVTDTGIGIPDEDKAHIFERFFQAGTNMRSSIGSGIGLHLVREYVKLQGGDITVSDNTESNGTVFRFTIPLRETDEKVKNIQQKPEDTAMKNDEEGKSGLTLLIVDDNQDLLHYMNQSFADTYHVITAEDGRQALQLLQTEDIDIIVSDVMMPEVDGIELCKRVKGNIETSHIPVILLTAKSMSSDELQGLEAGADDYITKPFSTHILQHRIHNIVERSKARYQRFASEIDIEPSEIAVTSLDEQFISQAISIVEQHISDPDFNVEQLSTEMGVHRSQLYKKLLHLTGKTPVVFIRILRLKRGKLLLEQSGMYVSEVAYQVGFNSPRIFSKYFKEEFGVTPKEFTK